MHRYKYNNNYYSIFACLFTKSASIKYIIRAPFIQYNVATDKVLAHVREEIVIHVKSLVFLRYQILFSRDED